jgi:hypothetical protein
VTIVGGYSRSGWANIILTEDLYGLKGLEYRCVTLVYTSVTHR